MKLNKLLLLLTLCTFLIAPAGCIFSPDDGGDDDRVIEELPPPTNKLQLMMNFETIYEDMLIDDYVEMLHEAYKTILLNETLDEWGWGQDFYFDKTIESAIHRNMFSGKKGKDSQGEDVHPIDSIVVDVLEQQGDWENIPEDDLWFGGYGGEYASYEVNIQFFNADLSHKFEVQQQVIFYVAPVQENGRTLWKMLGQRGLSL